MEMIPLISVSVSSFCVALEVELIFPGDDVKRLTKDLLFNEQGNLSFKPHLWNDLR